MLSHHTRLILDDVLLMLKAQNYIIDAVIDEYHKNLDEINYDKIRVLIDCCHDYQKDLIESLEAEVK